MAYKSFASGYLLKDGKILLCHSQKYNKWVPPGGHIEPDETPEQTVVREFKEEAGLTVIAISAVKNGLVGDTQRMPIAIPFHMGLYSEDFDVPHIGYFYFVRVTDGSYDAVHQQSEHFNIGWFDAEEIKNLETYEQVRSECAYVFGYYPKS